MKLEIIKLSVLTCIAGVFCKVYDDLNDNKLFELEIMKNYRMYKDYINEFLKGMHYILLTYISSVYVYPVLLFLIPNIILQYYNKEAFELPYEYSGMCCFYLLGIYLLLNNYSSLNYKFFIVLVLFFVGTYFTDILLFKHVEFGYKKIVMRFFAVLLMLLVLFKNILPDEVGFCFWYVIGYCMTSCIFQMYLIINSRSKEKEKQKQIKDEKEKQKQIKDEKEKEKNKKLKS